ncbi:sensor histidine kinase [Hymenobacter jeollabukensis]|uniref:histidine kinase n=1 Tax=Hymenobacter jeollabukensis TaxID=2025313 RepID=A0A5R8WJY6_9BACT|nr:HAMP domain-containing sensor histidine kinase [Hymenobacter jeollabukensis]TLM88942.1 HAMP domain-containing histidine kinase [Hymenobacter jeollabukensis]
MKLLTTTNRYYLILVLVLFALGTGVLYVGIQRALAEEVDEQLLFHRDYLRQRIRQAGALPSMTNPNELTISKSVRPPGLGDTLIYDPVERTLVPFRQVSFAVELHGQRYGLTLRKSLIETGDVLEVVLTVMLTVMGGLLGCLVLLNRWLSRWLWAPFYRTLDSLRGYRLQQPQALELPATPIDEFSELNQALAQLTQRVTADYQALKEFTENAAHETQTPLAIMQAQLEQLMQLPELPETAAQPVHELYRATRRLSRLHQALTLLSKIENRQFTEARPVQLDGLVRDKLGQLQEFLEAKQIEPELQVAAPLSVAMHPALADSLVSNLLQNAVKHNVPGGQLRIRLDAHALEIRNTGLPLDGDPTQLLGRFRKHNAASDSPGLGLSIAQQICGLYGGQLRYTFTPDGAWHTLRAQF